MASSNEDIFDRNPQPTDFPGDRVALTDGEAFSLFRAFAATRDDLKPDSPDYPRLTTDDGHVLEVHSLLDAKLTLPDDNAYSIRLNHREAGSMVSSKPLNGGEVLTGQHLKELIDKTAAEGEREVVRFDNRRHRFGNLLARVLDKIL